MIFLSGHDRSLALVRLPRRLLAAQVGSAIDIDYRAGREFSAGRRKEKNGICDFFGPGDAADRALCSYGVAFRGEPNAPAYGASKAGVNALSQSLAVALAPHNIFVGVVAPGFVETDMVTEMLASPAGDAIRAQSPVATTPEFTRNTRLIRSGSTSGVRSGKKRLA